MSYFLRQFINNFKKPKNWLLLVNILLVFFLIILNNLNVIPLRTGDFAFFALLGLALALYRPGWAFLFFIGTIMLENINLAPESLGISVRPYQFFGALIILAILIRLATKRLNFQLAKLKFPDYLVLIIVLAGFVSAIFGAGAVHEPSVRLAVIFASFVMLYFLARNYLQNLEDVKKIIPFFLSSSLIVMLYGVWQNVRFIGGKINFETMPGRPNATFTEADWLGMFLVLVISIIYILILCHSEAKPKNLLLSDARVEYPTDPSTSLFRRSEITSLRMTRRFVLFFTLVLLYSALILTVSRSAWLAALAATFFFLFIIFTNLKINPKNWQWKETISLKLKIISALLISVAIVYIFHLTNFKIFERVESIGGKQKITIACQSELSSANAELNSDNLEKYGCRHINLEEINSEKEKGYVVKEVYRQDPNVNIRAQIYKKSWSEIKTHWILGIGWGNIEKILGQDGRGAGLNSSNIFLEIWLGAGLPGLLAFSGLLLYILFKTVRNYHFANSQEDRIFNLFIIVSWFGMIVFNLFNAGLLLGFLWVWLGITNYEINTKYESTKIK